MKKRILPYFVLLVAVALATSAASYSVMGLAKLFSGASVSIIIMASTLELAKLVTSDFIYTYRKSLPLFLKSYLIMAVVVLMCITSLGIYGYLISAYQATANKASITDSKIELINTQKSNYNKQLVIYNEEKASINSNISNLREGLSNNKIQYKDKETGQIINTTSTSTRKSLERQLKQAINRQSEISIKTDSLYSKMFRLETQIVETKANDELSQELGPLKYISGLAGIPMDSVVNYLLLVIIFVFDPLAIFLVIAANFAFSQSKLKLSTPQLEKITQTEIDETIPPLKTTPPDSKNLTPSPPPNPPMTGKKGGPKPINSSFSAWRRNKEKKKENKIRYN